MTKKAQKAADKIAETSPDKAFDLAEFAEDVSNAKETKPKFDGIAVLGSHPATVDQAPFNDPKWLIYACSPHNIEQRSLPRVDEWFEVHVPIQDQTRSYHYLRSIEHFGHRVWMRVPMAPPLDAANNQEEYVQIQHLHEQAELQRQNIAWFKEAREYPEAEMKERFCPFMFTSSIAFMLAKAIVDCQRLNIPRIGIWGVMQASKSEYLYQRPGIQYFIWQATQFGIEVVAPPESRLFEPPEEQF
jgi:hypothetical protein